MIETGAAGAHRRRKPRADRFPGVRHRRHASQLNAALAALEAGVEEVRIAPGAAEGVLKRILEGEALGTRLVP